MTKSLESKYYDFINKVDTEIKPILIADGITYPYLTDICVDMENAEMTDSQQFDEHSEAWIKTLQCANCSVAVRLVDYGYNPNDYGIEY